MIHYQLRCHAAHEFDGWFRDSNSFDEQASSGLLACPACGCKQVARALMTPAVRKRRRTPPGNEITIPTEAVIPPPAQELPDAMRAALQRARAEVECHCDYVGGGFAEEARRIHRGESEQRGIYGETSPEEAAELADEGIKFSQLPWVPLADG